MSLTSAAAVVALCVSIAALAVSSAFTVRQLRLLRQANHVSALITLFSEFRSLAFHRNYNYVVYKLSEEHNADLGIFGLPNDAQAAVLDVAYHYQTFAQLAKLGILDEAQFLDTVRMRIIHTWAALEPFVRTERLKSPESVPKMLEVLEEYAGRAVRRLPV